MDNYNNGGYQYQEQYMNTVNERQPEQNYNTEKKVGKSSKKSFIVGFVVIAFAVTGLIFSISSIAKVLLTGSEKKQAAAAAEYETFLIPVAAIDPDGFDDVTTASMKELVHIAMWSIIGSDIEPGKYSYDDDELVIPAAEVERAFIEYFGSQLSIQHMSVEGYGYEFKYDSDKNAYIVPLTTITPVYTPEVTAVETKGGATVITCGLINSNMWMQDHRTGDISTPEPDKYIKVTIRETGGERYISSVQSSGTPETAIQNAVAYTTATEPAETTTEQVTHVITRN